MTTESSNIIIGIGGLSISNDQNSSIITYSLGSCIALIIYHGPSKTGGMAHIALSNSRTDPEKGIDCPGYFANTCIPELLSQMKKKINALNNSDLIVKIAGGASLVKEINFFDIGGQNIKAIKKEIKKNSMKLKTEDIGKNFSRTVSLNIHNGKVKISNAKLGKWEL